MAGAEAAGDALRGGEDSEAEAAGLGAAFGEQDAEGGDDGVVFAVDRRGDGDDDLLVPAAVDGQPLAADLGQGAAHDGRRDQHVVRLAVHGAGQEVFLHAGGREGEQDQADTGGVQRQPAADAVVDRRGLVAGQALDQGRLAAFADGQLDMLAGDLGQVGHERHGHLAQAVAAGRERGDLEQAQADAVTALLVTLQGAPADQVAGQPEGGADRDAAAAAEFGQGQAAPAGVEGRQQRQRAVDDRLALGRALAPGAVDDWLALGRGLAPGARLDIGIRGVFHWMAS